MQRREAVELLLVGPIAAGLEWTGADVLRAAGRVRDAARAAAFEPKFFTAHEWETVRILVDLVIPKDERSGSATDAGVPEFMDFMLQERESMRMPMRGGLAWLDTECRERFGKSFVQCAEPERRAVLDDIAWPGKARPELSHGVAFFNSFRDLTASGFWSSRMGIEDLRYIGNQFVAQWNGCPPEALRKLGLTAD
jgi:gluconate 2-dehydrogenase gamma chain